MTANEHMRPLNDDEVALLRRAEKEGVITDYYRDAKGDGPHCELEARGLAVRCGDHLLGTVEGYAAVLEIDGAADDRQ
jgi:hypothetical protein